MNARRWTVQEAIGVVPIRFVSTQLDRIDAIVCPDTSIRRRPSMTRVSNTMNVPPELMIVIQLWPLVSTLRADISVNVILAIKAMDSNASVIFI